MSQTYFAILTAVGEAKLANAIALNVPLQVSRMAVGDGGGELPVPVRTQTALIGEQYRADLNSLIPDPLNASQIIAELVIPETEGGYWLREMGLYDAAGDLIAVSNCPPSYKPEMAEGSGRTQVLRMVLIVSSTAAVQLKIDPSVVLATRAYADNLITVHQAAANPHPQYQLRGVFTSLNASTVLNAAHEGVVLVDATVADRTITLPLADAALGVRNLLIRRVDNTGNRLKVQASGANKIKFHTHLNAAGYAFLYLMGAGDWWHLRSDGAGNWWPIARHDSDALGRPVYETTTMVSPGGWGVFAGSMFNRADWPWLWDHGQQSGMLTTEAARVGMEGGWTSGDGALTFRGPEGRAEFLRILDDGRGIDTSRVGGSSQTGSLQTIDSTVTTFSVTGLYNAGTPEASAPSRFGLDSANSADYPNTSQMLAVGAAGGTSTIAAAPSNFGVTRPRNIAYPGRIKLI